MFNRYLTILRCELTKYASISSVVVSSLQVPILTFSTDIYGSDATNSVYSMCFYSLIGWASWLTGVESAHLEAGEAYKPIIY